MWKKDPKIAIQTLRNYYALVRTHIRNLSGFVLQQVNEGFMLTFANIADAVNFCLRLQVDLLEMDLPQHFSIPEYAIEELYVFRKIRKIRN